MNKKSTSIREEVTTLQAELERLGTLVFSLVASQFQQGLKRQYQQPQQQFGPVNPVFPGGYTIPNANPILGYPGHPPLGISLATQGFRDPNRQLPFIATLDLPNLSRLMNDPTNKLATPLGTNHSCGQDRSP